MKKILFVAFVALVTLVSCHKDSLDKPALVFTASITQPQYDTKTTIDDIAKIKWEKEDVILIADNSGNKDYYQVKEGAGTSSATFEFLSNSDLGNKPTLGEGPYTGTFGEKPSLFSVSMYSPSNSVPLYMEAPKSDNTDLTFSVSCGVLNINLTDANHKISVIEVFRKDNPENGYVLFCDPSVEISDGRDFYIALPEGNYNKIIIYDDIDNNPATRDNYTIKRFNTSKEIVVTSNRISYYQTSTFTFDVYNALFGVFSVSPTKKVRFSKGNLYYENERFSFEDRQYDGRTWSCVWPASKDGLRSSYYMQGVGLFFWSANADVAVAETYDDKNAKVDDVFFANSVMGPNWTTLSGEEWRYLVSGSGRSGKAGLGSVGDVHGLIILPDNFADPYTNNGNQAFTEIWGGNISDNVWTIVNYAVGSDWDAMEAAGAVFLPAMTLRTEKNEFPWSDMQVDINNKGGYYWSSEATNYMNFSKGNYTIKNDASARKYGLSVRLVTVVH